VRELPARVAEEKPRATSSLPRTGSGTRRRVRR
jgi:hypothetical protein